jgi:hypothetical protein
VVDSDSLPLNVNREMLQVRMTVMFCVMMDMIRTNVVAGHKTASEVAALSWYASKSVGVKEEVCCLLSSLVQPVHRADNFLRPHLPAYPPGVRLAAAHSSSLGFRP